MSSNLIPNDLETRADNNWVTKDLKFRLHQFRYLILFDGKEAQICGWVAILEGLHARLLHACQNSLFQQARDHN